MMSPTASRVLQAITQALAERDLESCAGGTVSIVVKLDSAGCPKRVAVRTEVEHQVDSRRPMAMTA